MFARTSISFWWTSSAMTSLPSMFLALSGASASACSRASAPTTRECGRLRCRNSPLGAPPCGSLVAQRRSDQVRWKRCHLRPRPGRGHGQEGTTARMRAGERPRPDRLLGKCSFRNVAERTRTAVQRRWRPQTFAEGEAVSGCSPSHPYPGMK